MSEVRRVTGEAEAVALAALLNSTERTRPVVVVTTPSHTPAPYIDAETVAGELDGLADVYVLETGPLTWTFSGRMAPMTQVYGGAGRVYPVDHAWVAEPRRSPLRLAFEPGEGERATQLLIDDGLAMAAAAGLLGATATRPGRRVHVEGVVRRLMSERAFVEYDGDRIALVPPPLAEPDLPIEQVLRAGMRVSGWLDPGSNWLDVRESRLAPETVLASYEIGDVVLARVEEVTAMEAVVLLHPDVAVRLSPDQVADDHGDDLRALLTTGEVLTVRVDGTDPWRLHVVDAEARPAVGLYDGGPPWLEPPAEVGAVFEPAPVTEPTAAPEPETSAVDTIEEAPPAPAAPPALPASPARPSPFLLDPRRRTGSVPVPPAAPASPPPPRGAAVESMALKVAALEAQLTTTQGRLAELEAQVSGLQQERTQLAELRAAAERQAHGLATQLQHLKAQLRKARSAKGAPARRPEFADRERGFRFAVEAAWASRTPVGEQAAKPLEKYLIGPEFLASLDAIGGVTEEKVADVVFEVVTHRAEQLAGRDMHRLRAGSGGDDPVRTREEDGAVCWRVALQRNTASARRLHFWRLPDGRVELSRVVLHDDMAP